MDIKPIRTAADHRKALHEIERLWKLKERIMATSTTGLVHGTTIELESAIPELEGKRVRVVLEAVDEPRISKELQHELWQAWAEHGPQGPIEDGPDTELS